MGTCLAWLACTCVRAQAPPPEIVLRNFGGAPLNGSGPHVGLIMDSAGNFYGTTEFGGAAGQGVVFKLDPTGHQTVLYSFTGGNDGGQPTYAGGSAGLGAIFKLDPAGDLTVLHSFTGGADGGNPLASVILDSAGNLYGTTEFGGGGPQAGVVFKLDSVWQRDGALHLHGRHRRAPPQRRRSDGRDRQLVRHYLLRRDVRKGVRLPPAMRQCSTTSPDTQTAPGPQLLWCSTRQATFMAPVVTGLSAMTVGLCSK